MSVERWDIRNRFLQGYFLGIYHLQYLQGWPLPFFTCGYGAPINGRKIKGFDWLAWGYFTRLVGVIYLPHV